MKTSHTTAPFVPPDLDPGDFDAVEPLLRQLADRTLDASEDLHRWLRDLSDLYEVISECGGRRHIDNACATENEAKEKAYLQWVMEIQPKLKPWLFRLQQKYVSHPHASDLGEPGADVMRREWVADVEVFREENVPLQARLEELSTEYGKIMGRMTVDFRGETLTLQQLARYLEEPDRPVRKEAWTLSVRRRLDDREAVNTLFDEQLKLRQEVAGNAGFEDFRAYIWKARKRFDYSPEDCLAFGQAVEKVCVPLLQKLDALRKKELGVDRYRPWDAAADPKSRPALRPFPAADIDTFVAGTKDILGRVAPGLSERFQTLVANDNLDLDSRKGKRPGGFQASLEASRQPFIFMNAAGTHRDVETLLHEAGHAFHYLAARAQPNVFVRHSPMEFAEVASMSMELLGAAHYEVFYTEEEALRARRLMLEGIIRVLPWVATIDGFQHWLYTHPGHSGEERTAAWIETLERFSSAETDWSGYEEARAWMWQRQGHLFSVPFYYIEYGIAQLGALGVWFRYRRDPAATLQHLSDAFELGGTVSLPRLFEVAGIPFAFTEDRVRELIEAVADELDALPV